MVAAGEGTRFGGRKQFADLGGRPVVSIAIETARCVASGVVLVIPRSATDADLEHGQGADTVVKGGATRADSVRAGLAAVPSSAGVIVVHDAVRPLATVQLFHDVVDAVFSGADAAIPAMPVTDTLKRVSGSEVVSTVSRQDLVAVQTPQAFKAAVLRHAHESASDATDDAALVERLGRTVRVVQGEGSNIKLTNPSDLQVLEALMKTAAEDSKG